jgi:hypothetical protein
MGRLRHDERLALRLLSDAMTRRVFTGAENMCHGDLWGWIMNPKTQKLLCVLFVSSVACGQSSSPVGPDPVVLDQQYVFACGRWSPQEPPVTRALVDLRMHGQTVDGRPTAEAIGAITAAGGRIEYVYNLPIVRAELDLHRVTSLVHLGRGPVTHAATVRDPAAFDVGIIVSLLHPLTAVDLESVRALGGTIRFEYQTLPGYAARVSDRIVPAIRALAGVKSIEADSIVCLF